MTKKNKNKKKNQLKINLTNWNTTDEDEVKRRQIRAELEKFHIDNLDPSRPYFSTYHVFSKSNKKYSIEIRHLDQKVNSCDCPDYRSNALGTCKHIEAVLNALRKKGVRKFKKANETGSDQIEIFLDTTNEPTIRIQKPEKIFPSVKKLIEPYFSSDGSLLGDLVVTFEKLKAEILKNKRANRIIRISHHIQHYVGYQKINSQKQRVKDYFLKDVALGKRTTDVVKHPLLPYQQEGMLHLAFTERVLLADEMGLGKTVQAIAACELLRRLRGIQRILVVTPASLKAEWEEQIAKFSDLSRIIVLGTRPKRLKQYQQNRFFYLVNYEQVISDHAEIQRLLAPDIIILDEAQRIKNWRTKTANAVKELKSRYAFVLTGTPVENRIDDIYSILQFLDPRIFGSLFRFNRDFYELDENGRPIGYKNLDVLYRRLRPIMLCRKKNDVEDELPKRLNKNYFISMKPEQRVRYEEYETRVARLVYQAKRRPLRKEEFEKLQKWLACMRMLCDTPYILDKDCQLSPKLDELENVLQELLQDQTTKIIIFSEWQRMLELVGKMTEKNNWSIAWHTGSVSQQKRRENIKRFKEEQDCRLFLSTDSGSVGLNLQVANVVINLDLPWNPAKLEQRIARAWRKYQIRSVQVINFICEGSIEHRMLYLLEQKQLLAKGVLTGDEDLKGMKMPSGRAAFMERMEALMQDKAITGAEKEGETTAVNTEEKIRDTLVEYIGTDLDLLHHYDNPAQRKQTFLAVCDAEPEILQEKLKPYLHEKVSEVEFIDRKTFDIIQRLIDKGILSHNASISVLHDKISPESTLRVKKLKIDEAKKCILQAERKNKMARLLLEGEFAEESISPLAESLSLTLQACVHLTEDKFRNEFSVSYIEETLVKRYGMPELVVNLFTQLSQNPENCQDVQKLQLGQKKIISTVNEWIDKFSTDLNKQPAVRSSDLSLVESVVVP